MRPLRDAERLRWRLARLWRRRGFRRAATVQVPALALALAGVALARDPDVHAWVSEKNDALRARIAEQTRFQISAIEIEGASPGLEGEIRAALIDAVGASSLTVDVNAVRERVAGLVRVAGAVASLEAPRTLRVRVSERRPVALWRFSEGLQAVDREGVGLFDVDARSDRPELPLIAGSGAELAVDEALALYAAAGPLAPRLRGLVRVGERRWNAELAYDVTLMLPADAPEAALRRAAYWQVEERLFDRDLSAVDLRLPARPVFLLRPRAKEVFDDMRADQMRPPA